MYILEKNAENAVWTFKGFDNALFSLIVSSLKML